MATSLDERGLVMQSGKTTDLSSLKSNGYVLYKKFFDPQLLDQIRLDAKHIFLYQFQQKNIKINSIENEAEFEHAIVELFNHHQQSYLNASKACQHLVSLHRLSLSENIIQRLRGFNMVFPNICTRPVIYFNKKTLAKSEGFYKTPPHQDWRSMQGSLNAMVVWIPLVDINKELGALEVIPGSHLRGLLDSKKHEWYRELNDVDSNEFVSITVEKGDALFFSAFLIHQSGNNITDSSRWSCHFRYNDMNEKTYIEHNYPNPYLYQPVQDLLVENFPTKQQVEKIFEI